VGTEYLAGDGSELSKDVTWRRSIRTSLSSCAELTVWSHQVDVVGPDKGLCETNDCGVHTLFTVMVRRMFSDISSQLCDLQLITYNCSDTLISLIKFLLKEPNKTLRWPGFMPSTMDGIERILSAMLYKMSSLLMKSEIGILSTV